MKNSLLLIALLLTCAFAIDANAQTREEYSYDDMGRVSRYRVVQGDQAYVVSYEYDNRSNITRTFSEVVSSVDETDRILSISVRPNPVSSEVIIESPTVPGSTVSFAITSRDGAQMVAESVIADDSGIARLTLDTVKRKLPSGSYDVSMHNGAMRSTASFVVVK